MRVLFTSTRGDGHIRPLFPFALALRQAGHDVLFAAPAGVTSALERHGFDLRPLPDPLPEASKAVMQRLDAAEGDAVMHLAIRELFFGLQARTALAAVLEVVRDWRPHLVVREASEPCGAIAAEQAGIPHARVDVHNPEIEAMFVAHGAPAIDALRLSAGLLPDGGAAIRAEPMFTSFPQALDKTSPERPPFRVRNARAGARVGRDGTMPFVYITMGTLAGRLPKSQAAYRIALAAVADLPVRALLTTGPVMPVAELGVVPANVEVATFVPQADILPKASLVLCHGGAGTVLGALATGVPMVITPLFADQPANARSVAAAGAGLCPDMPTAETVRAAICRVLSEPNFVQRAGEIADQIAALPSVEDAIGALLHLARSGGEGPAGLVPRPLHPGA